MLKTNAPYVKKYENGILVNPITKENPYLFTAIKTQRTYPSGFWQRVRNKFFVGRNIVKAY